MEAHLERLIVQFLGPAYAGRRFLRYREIEAIGLVANRGTLRLWIERGAFPHPLKPAGPGGRSTLWSVAEIAAALAERVNERNTAAGDCT